MIVEASRKLGAVLASLALIAPAAGAGAVSVAIATGAVAVVRTDWQRPWSDPRSDQETGPGAGSSEVAAAVSKPAAQAQSIGIVVVDTVLPYQDARGAGTGMVLTSTGQVLTNYHVVENASTIKVTVVQTGKVYTAAVVGSDETDDVALLQLKGISGLSTVMLDNDEVAVGDKVTAVGNAGGTGELTAATGTISSLRASLTTQAEGSVAPQTLSSMIETTADVVSGDSGGPLYDAEGEVVGIDTAASTGSEINGYAIPIERALRIVQQIRSGQESSTVQIGAAAFLGVELSGTGSYPDSNYFGSASGAVVSDVVDGTAAAQAGLESGDIITAVGGHVITSAGDVQAVLKSHDPGDRVKITWIDQWESQHTTTVALGTSPVA